MCGIRVLSMKLSAPRAFLLCVCSFCKPKCVSVNQRKIWRTRAPRRDAYLLRPLAEGSGRYYRNEVYTASGNLAFQLQNWRCYNHVYAPNFFALVIDNAKFDSITFGPDKIDPLSIYWRFYQNVTFSCWSVTPESVSICCQRICKSTVTLR